MEAGTVGSTWGMLAGPEHVSRFRGGTEGRRQGSYLVFIGSPSYPVLEGSPAALTFCLCDLGHIPFPSISLFPCLYLIRFLGLVLLSGS